MNDRYRISWRPNLSCSNTLSRGVNVFLCIVLMVLAVIGMTIVLESFSPTFIYSKDVMQEYVLAKAALAGINPYQPLPELITRFVAASDGDYVPHPTPHPPSILLFILPMGLMRYELIVYIWLGVELLCLGVIAVLASRFLEMNLLSISPLVVFAGLLTWLPIITDLYYGQLSVTLLLILLCAWLALRQDHEYVGGSLLGVAIAIKLIAWPFFILLLIKKKWKAFFAGAGVVAIANIFAICMMGLHTVIEYYTKVSVTVSAYYRAFSFNYSLWTVGWRLFNGMEATFIRGVIAPPLIDAPVLAKITSILIPLVILLAGILFIVKSHVFDVNYCVFICISLLISPVVWTHYYVWLFLPLVVLVGYIWRYKISMLRLVLLIAVVLLYVVNDNFMEKFTRFLQMQGMGSVSETFHIYLPFWGSLITLAPYIPVFLLLWALGSMQHKLVPEIKTDTVS